MSVRVLYLESPRTDSNCNHDPSDSLTARNTGRTHRIRNRSTDQGNCTGSNSSAKTTKKTTTTTKRKVTTIIKKIVLVNG